MLCKGKFEFIGGVRCYVGTPSGEYAKDKVILYLSDIFGIDLVNAQLLVDDFARNGFKTIAIDYLNGDPIPEDAFAKNPDYDFYAWLVHHGNEVTRPHIDKVMAVLKAQGVTVFGAAGYCFGARYSFDLAFEKAIKATAIAHPALLKIPEDLEKYKNVAEAPLLINSCTVDHLFPLEAQAEADRIIGGGKQFTENYRREYFEGCTHGFAVRADLSDPTAKAGKEGSFKATVEFFKKHL
ncbi:hypothetical protein ID866_8356 [Astraeus odoratus]|nr:hypothetical protein ID866_8356 [Astraeus odoratus]